MGRDYKEIPCPKCGSKNVEQTNTAAYIGPASKLKLFTDCHCYGCNHNWRA